MTQVRTQIHILPSDGSAVRAFRTGVSLHSHTEHSQENLTDLPQIIERLPVVAQFVRWETQRYRESTGKAIDFSRVYRRGPLCARSAHYLERRQIETLGLEALVSLTDHDDIEAGMLLQSDNADRDIPISVEWSVPYERTYFHLGIHNLPPTLARSLMSDMAEFTARPEASLLGRLLEQFDAHPEMLVVMNHPLWDMAKIGSHATTMAVRRFLNTYGSRIHALEMNGLRPWNENLGVVKIAADHGKPVVSGGDRHGLEPSATINLTRASTFAAFVQEIRQERSSDIAVLPQYGEPLLLRHLLTAWDVVKEHPQLEDRRRWTARVFVADDQGIERPLCGLWSRAPGWIDPCLNVVGLLASAPVRTAGRLAGLGARSAV
jgi:hypothetical protein